MRRYNRREINSARRLFDPASLFTNWQEGFLPAVYNPNYVRQTYNSPATTAASAGDPIGLWTPAQAGEAVTNLVVHTDNFASSTWTKTAGGTATVTSDVKNAPSEVLGGAPVADLITDPAEVGAYQNVTVSSTGLTVCHSRYLFAGTASVVRFRDDSGAGRDVLFNISTGVASTVSGSFLNYGIEDKGGGWYRAFIAFTNDNTTVRNWVRTTSAGTFYTCGAQTELGVTTPSTYQPNAGCLGGSNRRTGGSNMLLWSQNFANPGWSKVGTTVSDAGVMTEDTGNTQHNIQQAISYIGQQTLTVRTSLSSGTRLFRLVHYNATDGAVEGYFNLQTGAVASGAAASIVAVGGGVYDCSITFTNTVATTVFICAATAVGTITYIGDGTSAFALSRAHCIAGTAAGTYSHNMDQLGGLLTSAVLFQSTSGNRGTRARWPATQIKNLFTTATATFTTRTFTTLAVPYTFSFKGTGTVTLSGTSTAGPLVGTGASDRVSLTFTPTAGALTLTLSGSATEGMIQFGSTMTAYQDVVTASDITESGISDRWSTLWDGTSDYGTFGVQSFGTASLFADAGQAWTVWGAFQTTANPGSAQTLLAKAGSTAASMTLRVFISNVGDFRITCRGTETATSVTVNDGAFHTWVLRWSGTTLTLWLNGTSYAITVGSAAEEAQNITVAARTESAGANFLNGRDDAAMTAYALSDSQIAQLMSYLNNYYRSGL